MCYFAMPFFKGAAKVRFFAHIAKQIAQKRTKRAHISLFVQHFD